VKDREQGIGNRPPQAKLGRGTRQNNAVAATKLNALIRRTEVRMVVIDARLGDGDDPKSMLELLEKLTAEINEITSTSQPVVKSKGR